MLTAKNVDFHQAISYYAQDSQGYYQTTTIRWWGSGAEKLGLLGKSHSQEVFVNICAGLAGNGTKLGRERSRCAIDLTFSASKSVSLCALVGEDDRVVTAHRKAVEKTLEVIEKRYSQTRVRLPIGHTKVKTGNLVVAQFDHNESRELDPHLHTHALVMNLTQVNEKGWYSLSNEEIYKHKKHLGMIYQSYLRTEVEKLGYQTTALPHGQFEIAGFKKLDLVEFSKRRQQIISTVGVGSEWITRENAWSITRKSKKIVAIEELKQAWKREAQALGISVVKPDGSIQYNSQNNNQTPTLSQQHLDEAIEHCSQRTVQFTLEDLEKFILNQQLSSDVNELLPLIQQNRQLLKLADNSFTTLVALRREEETINLMQRGQKVVEGIASAESVDSFLEHFRDRFIAGKNLQFTLNQGQRAAVKLASTTRSRVIAWQGVAGSGKTFALSTFKDIATASGYTLVGLAPSSEAAKLLGQELGITASTVKRKLVSSNDLQSKSNVTQKQIWVVDEAGLLGATEALDLLRLSEQEDARVVLVGDTRQLSAVDAGNPFKSLQEAGMETAFLNEGLRQKNKDLKAAVALLARGAVEQGFKKLDSSGSIVEVEEVALIDRVAKQYLSLDAESRAKTLVLAGTNERRRAITAAIRSKLQDLGEIGINTRATQLVNKNLSSVEMKYTSNFEIGDIVIPLRSYKQRGLVKGEHYLVAGKNDTNLVLSCGNKQQIVDTGFEKAVYRTQVIEIAVGDKLKWTKNDYKLGRTNGQEFTVEKIEGNKASIRYQSGNTETIDLQKEQHFDSALVLTTFASQGKTADYVLWASDFTTGMESFYVAASRAKYDLKIFTESKKALLEQALLSRRNLNPSELLLDKEGLDQEGLYRGLRQEAEQVLEQNVSSTENSNPGAQKEESKLNQIQQQERAVEHLRPSRRLRI